MTATPDPDLRARFAQEVDVVANLQHPNVIHAVDGYGGQLAWGDGVYGVVARTTDNEVYLADDRRGGRRGRHARVDQRASLAAGVVYLCDCAVKPLDLYHMLAAELGLRPGPRAQIVADIKRALVSLVDERGVVPIVILDDAQGLRDDLLHELHGLTSLDFDGREYLTIWLVGHPLLARRLRLQQHAAAGDKPNK